MEEIGEAELITNGDMEEIESIEEMYDPCPDCGLQLKALWSGVKCPDPKCGYWFCW